MKGELYIIATPIGNLEDITLRALRVLKEADVVFAEDTRVTKKLFVRYDIDTKLERLDAKVEREKSARVMSILEEGKSVALVSDAGTPTISDPGARLVQTVREAGFSIATIPGPSAITAALSISGIPADEFVFLGFPPHKKGRRTFFKNISEEKRTVVFYESPHRILKSLALLSEYVSINRNIVVARELTKMHEEVLEGNASEILETLTKDSQKQKGEFVVIYSPKATHK